jgi:orotidine-5'-phosphate decarboxylase
MSAAATFGERVQSAFDEHGRLCVGIDPHAWLLERWALEDSAGGAREFGLRVIDAAAGRVGIVKPQVAFFERFGSAGYAALERVMADARAAGLLVIADVKRGDVGTSVEAYGEAWLRPGSATEADAMTLSAFQGLASNEAVLRLAEANGKGVFVLAATSNPEAAAIQRAVLQQSSRAGDTVSAAIVAGVTAWNADQTDSGARPLGSIGVVIGATVDLAEAGIDRAASPPRPGLPILAPGFGHQGAPATEFPSIFGPYAAGVIVSESRSLLDAGPEGIAEAILRRSDEIGGPVG